MTARKAYVPSPLRPTPTATANEPDGRGLREDFAEEEWPAVGDKVIEVRNGGLRLAAEARGLDFLSVSYGLKQALLIGLGGVLFCAVVFSLARRQLISLRYAVGWTMICLIGVVGALLTPVVEPVATFFGMSPTGVLLTGATVVLLAITLQLSVSVSGLQAELRDVAEAHALVDARLRELEQRARA